MPKKARHKCKFCGQNGHDLRTCALPGAVLLRELLKKKDMSVNKLGEGLRGLEEERKEQLRRRRKSGTLAEMVVPKLKEKDLTRIQRTSKNRKRFWKHKFPKLANLLKIVGRSVCLKVFFECQKNVRSAVTGATTKNLNGSVPRTKENSMSVSSSPLTHIM